MHPYTNITVTGTAPAQGDVRTGTIDPGWTEGFLTFNGSEWDPDLNNISIKVWKPDNTTMEKTEIWTSGFPTIGSVPYILATDITDTWTDECQDIRNKDWFRNKYMNDQAWP